MARPRRNNLTETVRVRVDRNTKRMLSKQADKERVSESRIVRRIIREHLERVQQS